MDVQRWRKEIQAEDINLEVIRLEMIFKAIKLDESIKGIHGDRKKDSRSYQLLVC